MKPPTAGTVYEIYAAHPRHPGPAYWVLNRQWAQELKANLYGERHGDQCPAPRVVNTDRLLGLPIVLTDRPTEPRLVIDNAGYL